MKKFLIALLFVGAFSSHMMASENLEALNEMNISELCCSLEAKLAEIDAKMPCLEGEDKCLLEEQRRNIEDVIGQLQEIEETKGIMETLETKTQSLQEFFSGLQRKTIYLAIGAGVIALTGICLGIWGIVKLKNSLKEEKEAKEKLENKLLIFQDREKQHEKKVDSLTDILTRYEQEKEKAEKDLDKALKLAGTAKEAAKQKEEFAKKIGENNKKLSEKILALSIGFKQTKATEDAFYRWVKENPKNAKKFQKTLLRDPTEEEKESGLKGKIETPESSRIELFLKKAELEKEEEKQKKEDEKKRLKEEKEAEKKRKKEEKKKKSKK